MALFPCKHHCLFLVAILDRSNPKKTWTYVNYLLNTSSVLSCFELSVYSKPRVCCVLVDWWLLRWSNGLSASWLVMRRNEEEAWSLANRGWILHSSPQPSHFKNKMMFLGPGYLGATTLKDSRPRHFSETRKLFGAVAVITGEMRFPLRKDLDAKWESPGLWGGARVPLSQRDAPWAELWNISTSAFQKRLVAHKVEWETEKSHLVHFPFLKKWP